MTDSQANITQFLELLAGQIANVSTQTTDALVALQTSTDSERSALKTELEGLINTKTDQLTTANTNLGALITSLENSTDADVANLQSLINQNSTLISQNQTLLAQLQNTDTVTNETIADLEAKDTELENSLTALTSTLNTKVAEINTRIDNEVATLNTSINDLSGVVTANKTASDNAIAGLDTRTSAIETDLNAITVNSLASAFNTGVTAQVPSGSNSITIGGVNRTIDLTITIP